MANKIDFFRAKKRLFTAVGVGLALFFVHLLNNFLGRMRVAHKAIFKRIETKVLQQAKIMEDK